MAGPFCVGAAQRHPVNDRSRIAAMAAAIGDLSLSLAGLDSSLIRGSLGGCSAGREREEAPRIAVTYILKERMSQPITNHAEKGSEKSEGAVPGEKEALFCNERQ